MAKSGSGYLVGGHSDNEGRMSSFAMPYPPSSSGEAKKFECGATNADLNIRGGLGKVTRVFLQDINANGKGARVCKALLVTEGGVHAMLQKSKVLWTGHEALSHIVDLVSTDKPFEKKKIVSSVPSLGSRLSDQARTIASVLPSVITAVKDFSSAINGLATGANKRISGKISQSESAVFGFEKVLVFLSRSGRIFGLHSESGEALWTRFFSGTVAGATKIYASRGSVVSGKLPSVLILVRNSATGNDVAHWVDSVSGDIVQSSEVGDQVIHSFLLPLQAQDNERVLVALTASGKVVSLDSGLNPRKAAATLSNILAQKKLVMHVVEKDGSGINGYAVREVKKYKFEGVRIWRVVASPGATIVGTSVTSKAESVYAPAHIQGDDGLLMKYINPHLMLVATYNDEVRLLTIMLLDTVTGNIVYRISHKDAGLPVHVARTENWGFYSFWNGASGAIRTEIGALALYESEVPPHALNPWTSLPKELREASDDSGSAIKTTFSSYTAASPIVLHKRFIFPTGIRSLAASQTKRGCTEKQLLIGMQSGQILQLDRRFIDPRRPEGKPTKSDTAEGLLAYSPYLPIIPSSVITYFQAAARLNSIYSLPAELESTSLVVGTGLDIVYVRAIPSKGFDLIPDDFAYGPLTLICVGMFVGAMVAKQSYETKKLKRMWK